MRRDPVDAIIGFPNQSHWDQFQADTRYLTHIGGHQTEVAVVFPLSGEVTAFVRGGNEIEWWHIAQDWVREIRASRRSWGEPVVERMKELKLDGGRIGVSGLSGLLRAPEGTVVAGILEKVRRAFPGARFENATELLQEARAVRGTEEIAPRKYSTAWSRRYSRRRNPALWKLRWLRRSGTRSSSTAATIPR